MFIPVDRYLELPLTDTDVSGMTISIHFATGKALARIAADREPGTGEFLVNTDAKVLKFSEADAGREIRVVLVLQAAPVPA